MFKRQTNEILYFSTIVELQINGMVFRPSICYKVPPFTKNSLDKLAAEKKVTFYTSPVRFVNGAVVSVKAEKPVVGVPSVIREEMQEHLTSRKKRK